MYRKRGTENFHWDEENLLGKGVTSSVYEGFNTQTGQQVAVKVAKDRLAPANFVKECDVLKELNHKNIVKLIAVEKELCADRKVIIMELCKGGSLRDILEDPENSYGLAQHEFVLVLEHLCAGLKYLHDKKIIHRNLKPGNIMKYITEEDQICYKLVDFGTARHLIVDEEFTTLCGTEEYLHPEIYEMAVLLKPKRETYSANTDLWSIGVTLYHIATGLLPFRSFLKRDHALKHLIMMTKTSDIISGVQSCKNGPIEWSTTLPTHCHLSQSLKSLLTPLLVGLLEPHRASAWSFERFFDEVSLILCKRVVHVFYVNKSTRLEIYLDTQAQYSDFCKQLFEQTDVQIEQQILLYNNNYLEKSCTNSRPFPLTTADTPIFLFNNDDNNIRLFEQFALQTSPDDNDLKEAYRVGHAYLRRIKVFDCANTLLEKSIEQFITTLSAIVARLFKKIQNMDAFYVITLNLAVALEIYGTFREIDKDLPIIVTKLNDLKKSFEPIRYSVLQLHHNDNSITYLSTLLNNNKFPSLACATAKGLVERLRINVDNMRLLNDRKEIIDKQFLALEKIKLNANIKRLKHMLHEEIEPILMRKIDCLADLYKLIHTIYDKTKFFEKTVHENEHLLNELNVQLKHIKSKIKSETFTVAEVSQIYKLRESHKELMNTARETKALQNIIFNSM